MVSVQTLSESDRRLLAPWAAACAERVLPLFETAAPEDRDVRDALDRVKAFGEGRSTAAAEIRRRFVGFGAASTVTEPAAVAAARSVGQAAAVAHMGAHALGAAAYAVKAVTLASSGSPEAREDEVAWQLAQLTAEQRDALRQLPPLGSDKAGPLGPGLLSRGILGDVIRQIQAAVAD